MTGVGLGETGMLKDGLPRILCTSPGAVTGSGSQAARVIVVVAASEPLEGIAAMLLLVGWWKPRCMITAGGDGDTRPRSPSAEEETMEDHSLTCHTPQPRHVWGNFLDPMLAHTTGAHCELRPNPTGSLLFSVL